MGIHNIIVTRLYYYWLASILLSAQYSCDILAWYDIFQCHIQILSGYTAYGSEAEPNFRNAYWFGYVCGLVPNRTRVATLAVPQL